MISAMLLFVVVVVLVCGDCMYVSVCFPLGFFGMRLFILCNVLNNVVNLLCRGGVFLLATSRGLGL